MKISGIPIPAKTMEIVREIASIVGGPIEVDEISLMRVDPVRVKVNCRDPASINCFVEIFINIVGFEIRFEAERVMEKKRKGHVKVVNPKTQDKRKDEEEEESNGSTHKTEWEKLAEKYGGDSHQSDHKSGGESHKTKTKNQGGSDSDESIQGKEIVEFNINKQIIPALPLAFSYLPMSEDHLPLS